MSFEHRPSPARVTEAAAAKLPRWMFFGLLAAYIVPGLFGRDPWSLEDASAFGVMWTMAHGDAVAWWLPSVVGEPLPEEGPLPFWIGALLIRLFGGLFGDIVAARLVTVLWFLVATTSLWYATYRLARRPEAQPVAFAFGGEANPRDYGRMLADIAVLLMLATIGIVLRMHETVAETALFAFVSMLLLALAVSLEDPWKGTVGAGVALAAIALTRGLLPAGALMIAALIFVLSFGRHRALRAIVVVAIAGRTVRCVAARRSKGDAASGAVLRCLVGMERARVLWPQLGELDVVRAQCRLVHVAAVAVRFVDVVLVAQLLAPAARTTAVADHSGINHRPARRGRRKRS